MTPGRRKPTPLEIKRVYEPNAERCIAALVYVLTWKPRVVPAKPGDTEGQPDGATTA